MCFVEKMAHKTDANLKINPSAFHCKARDKRRISCPADVSVKEKRSPHISERRNFEKIDIRKRNSRFFVRHTMLFVLRAHSDLGPKPIDICNAGKARELISGLFFAPLVVKYLGNKG
jgi:hypothetical protein